MIYVNEPKKQVPVIFETEVLVLGGSSTGVFAAVRAARRGKKVTLVERNAILGGTATAAMVCHWPSGLDAYFEKRIIGGLSFELIENLKKIGAVSQAEEDTRPYSFIPAEMCFELDRFVTESGIKLYLHTLVCDPYVEDDKLCGVFVENKDGRGLIKAEVVIDCTGDGDLLYRLGVESYVSDNLQPPTPCFVFEGLDEFNASRPDLKNGWRTILRREGPKYGLKNDWGWTFKIPDRFDHRVVAKTHVLGGNLCKADDLTMAELEARKQGKAMSDMLRDNSEPSYAPTLVSLPYCIGIRQTRQFKSICQVKGQDLLNGVIPKDCIGKSANRIDRHNGNDGSVSFMYLTGEMVHIPVDDSGVQKSIWLKEGQSPSSCYGIPFSCAVPKSPYPNLLMAGRMLDTDDEAFGALRLQMYLNEIGEATGEAAAIMLDSGCAAKDIDISLLQKRLVSGGTIL